LLALTTTKYIPSLKLVTVPDKLTLSITIYNAGIGIGIITNVASLTTSGKVPTLTFEIIPDEHDLSITTYAAVLRKNIPTDYITLSITTYVPTVTAGGGITVVPGLVSLTTVSYAPTYDMVVFADIAALTITTYEPTAEGSAAVTVTPDKIDLAITGYASELDDVIAGAAPTGLTLAFFESVVKTDIIGVEPTALILTLYTPTAQIIEVFTVSPVVLTITAYAPDVAATGNIWVTPDVKSLAITAYVPKLALNVIPDVKAILTSLFGPTIQIAETGLLTEVIPTCVGLALSLSIPYVHWTSNLYKSAPRSRIHNLRKVSPYIHDLSNTQVEYTLSDLDEEEQKYVFIS
jgi:hypothetical protein